MASGPMDRERFEVNNSYGGSTSQRVYSSNSQNSADTEEKVQKVSPPRRKVTREEKSEKMGNWVKKDGGGSDLSTTNFRQANANTNNVGHRQYDPEPPTDGNINAILEVGRQCGSFCFIILGFLSGFSSFCVYFWSVAGGRGSNCCSQKRN